MHDSIEQVPQAKVLIVDDDSDSADILASVLQRRGYMVEVLFDSRQAIELVQRLQPDIILLDVMMPHLDGYTICEALKADPQLCDIPVIFLSALSRSIDTVRAFAVGGVDYVTKPFQVSEMQVRIATHLTLRRMHDRLREQNAQLQQEVVERLRVEEALQQSEYKLNQILQTMIDGVVMVKPDGEIVYVNPAATRILEASYQNIAGQPYTSRDWHQIDEQNQPLSPEQLPLSVALRERRVVRNMIHGLRAGDGTAKWISVNATPLLNAQNEVYGAIASFSDITERKHAYDELELRVQERTAALTAANHALQTEVRQRKGSEQRYKTLVETSPSAILLTDLRGRIEFCNQQAATLFGYDAPENLYGKNGSELVAEDSVHRMHIEMIFEPQRSRNLEYIMCKQDGSRFYAEVNGSVVPGPEGRPASMIIVIHDISQRKKAEQLITEANHELAMLNCHLSHQQNLLQAMFDGLEDGVLLLDAAGRVQLVNRTMADLLGTTAAVLVGHVWAVVYPQVAPAFPGHLILNLSEIGCTRYERIRFIDSSGVVHILTIQVIALGSASGSVDQVILHVSDITETVRLQEQVIASERLAATGRLAASVAHEINTPLQTIQTSLKLMTTLSDEDHSNLLVDALEEMRRVGRIVSQLLDVYRPMTNESGQLDLNALLERILLLLGKRIRDQRIVIQRCLSAQLPLVHGRSDELTQVMLNLVINALDVMPRGGTLCIQTYQGAADDETNLPSGWTRVCIGDTGPGISPGLQTQIFEPFITTKARGIGLGLSICKQIIEQHGGRIYVVSRMGEGSVFTIELPIEKHAHRDVSD